VKKDRHSDLTVKYLPIESLSRYSSNARAHSKPQILQIAESIRVFGFTNPVLIAGNNTIIAGHGRVMAAKLLGMTLVPTIRLEGLSDDQIRAYVLADNRLAEKAGWDKSILAIELQHLIAIDSDIDVTITGFEIPEIDLILEEARDKKQDNDDVFQIDESIQAITQPGDLWQLGKHRVLCGNSLAELSLKTLMARQKAGVACADPPFNVKIDGHASGNGQIHHREFAIASGEMNEAEFVAFLTTWLLNVCVWVKNNGGMGSFYRSRHELVFVFRNGKDRHRNNIQLGQYGRNRTNVWEYAGVNTLSRRSDEGNLLALHPTVKPVAMVADPILDCSARGEIVLDTFLGSGTTLIAAERVGRICHGIEIDPLYVDVAIRRWHRHSGDLAIHVATGKSFDEIAASPEVRHGR
jgi:DNA modification methylase